MSRALRADGQKGSSSLPCLVPWRESVQALRARVGRLCTGTFRFKVHPLATGLILLVVVTACVKKEATVKVAVEAKTNQGDPVSAAVVTLDGKKLGETDNHGKFAEATNLKVGTRVRLEVRKESDTYYFAPYAESYVVGEKSTQALDVHAILYFVPKPTPEGEKVAAAKAQVAAAEQPGIKAPQAVPAEGGQGGASAAVAASPSAAAAAPGGLATTQDNPSVAAAPSTASPQSTGNIELSPMARDLGVAPADANATTTETPANDSAKLVADQNPQEHVTKLADVLPDQDQAKSAADETASDAKLTEDDGTSQDLDHPVTLSPVDETSPSSSMVKATRVAAPRANVGRIVYTVHVFAGESPVVDADVAFGDQHTSDLKTGCHTNPRGRCVIRFAKVPDGPVTFVAAKSGFKTTSRVAAVRNKGQLRIDLEHGQTLDIYALTQVFDQTAGLEHVEVEIGGKHVGETDRFGRYSYAYEGKSDDLLPVALKIKNYLPETYETDFVAAGPMKLIKFFTPDVPPAVRMAVLPATVAGQINKGTADTLKGFDAALHTAVAAHIYASSAFKEYPLVLLDKEATRIGLQVDGLPRTGWIGSDLKDKIDALLVPTVIAGAHPALQLGVVDGRGHVLAAARADLAGLADKESIDRAVAAIAKKITRVFPFEGAVVGKEGAQVRINLGQVQGRGVKPGDKLDVYGVQAEKFGLSRLHRRIAMLTVRSVLDQTSVCDVGKLVPRATIERGDQVILRTRKAPDTGGAEIRVIATGGPAAAPVARANVYLNDRWVGATDESGRLALDVTGRGTLRVVKQGFEEFLGTKSLTSQTRLAVALKREAAFLRVDSQPQGATIRIDGKVLGKTPLAQPVPVPSGFVKLELEAPGGFKNYASVLELDQGTLDLTGVNKIVLERDFRAEAQRLLKADKVPEALAILNSVPKDHSDYLLARHEAGEIYLTMLDQPAKAAEAFGEVTANAAVKQFADKRFIGSHIDEGIALFLTAERLKKQSKPEAARAHYQKALEVLNNVAPELRFVPAEQYAAAVHNVDYHRALCLQRLWNETHDPRLARQAIKTWQTYLEGDARTVPAEGTSKTYVENAAVYLKQAKAELAAPRTATAQ